MTLKLYEKEHENILIQEKIEIFKKFQFIEHKLKTEARKGKQITHSDHDLNN